MLARRLAATLLALHLLTCLGCGGGGGDSSAPDLLAATGTLAYVVTECRDTAAGFVERQSLRIQQGSREAITVMETPGVGPITGIGGLCEVVSVSRFGEASITRQAIQAVRVSPDGAAVAFEVTDDFSTNPPLPLNLAPEQKGIFVVNADGSGLRRLGDASRERFFYINDTRGVEALRSMPFSPNGRMLAFVDKGPDANGNEADQVMTIDVSTGKRTQVTRLPAAAPPPGYPFDTPSVFMGGWGDDATIHFDTSANPDGLNADGNFVRLAIKTDGSNLEAPLPTHLARAGGVFEPTFVITGDRPFSLMLPVPGTPVNHLPGALPQIQELFVGDQHKNLLQLTNFRRVDTGGGPLDPDREHFYFTASADPLGTNPSENCQIFSIDRIGTDLRQLTHFHESEHAQVGCRWNSRLRGCASGFLRQDPRTQSLIFYSSCDPLGTNPRGGQVFAMRPDGSGFRQLTDIRGVVTQPDGTVLGELPGPWSYAP